MRHEPGERENLDDEEPGFEDSEIATEAEVSCPYCGETVTIALDPDGGLAQEYIEDCPVCCRPWRVHLSYDEEGAAEVSLEQAE